MAQRRTRNIYDTYFTRVISAWITAALAPFDVSPNAVSLINFVVGLIGCVLIGLGSGTAVIIGGVLLVHLYAILDSVDGELARLLDRRSLRGMFLEDWSAYGMIAVFPVAIALYLVSAGSSSIALVVAFLFAALGRNTMPALRRAIAKSDETPRLPSRPPGVTRSDKRVSGWKASVEGHLLHHTNIRLVLTSLVVVHLIVGLLPPLELGYYAYMIALLMREAAILFKVVRGDLVERELEQVRGPVTNADQSVPTAPV